MLSQPGAQSHVLGVWFFSADWLITGKNLEWTSSLLLSLCMKGVMLGFCGNIPSIIPFAHIAYPSFGE